LQAKGDAKIISPSNGQEIEGCIVPVRIQGNAAKGKAPLVYTKQQDAAYYLESKVEPVGPGMWSASVQIGQAKASGDEDYAISVIELDEKWVPYLGAVVQNAAKDWGVEDQEEATYWNTLNLPPGVGDPLHSINVHRMKKDDPSCPE
jgi:hypothetical protein